MTARLGLEPLQEVLRATPGRFLPHPGDGALLCLMRGRSLRAFQADGDRDPDSAAKLRHNRAVAAAENASPGAKTNAVQLAPLTERQNSAVEPGHIERASMRPDPSSAASRLHENDFIENVGAQPVDPSLCGAGCLAAQVNLHATRLVVPQLGCWHGPADIR